MPTDRSLLIRSFEVLKDRLSESDVRTLCFCLGIEYEDLPGAGRNDKIRELLVYLERRDRLSDLIREGDRTRPDIPWEYLVGSESGSQTNQVEHLPDYPYAHFTNRFRDIIAPLRYTATGSVANIVFGSISEVEQTTVVIPTNQDFDLFQRGPRSVLASFEEIVVNDQLFFDALEALWPERMRPKNAGIGSSQFIPLPQNSKSLNGILFTVTTRNLSSNAVHYGRYVNTPLEGIDYVLDCVLRCAKNQGIESVALPLLGTGYANIGRTSGQPNLNLLVRKIVAGLTIRKLEDSLTDRESKLRRGFLVVYSSRPNSNEENTMWEFVVRFTKSDPQKRLTQLDDLTKELQVFGS
jgi:hypothetical protein